MYITKTAVPILKIILFLVLTPIYGIWGVVVALIISQLATHTMNLYFFWRM